MKNPLISVIVPVYKAEKYIRKCVDSLLYQSFKNFELILVDDGSPDNSGKICDEYSQLDDRVKVIHKKNGGVSSARNTGIEYAKGEWITFIDSDDWLDKETLQVCLKFADQYEYIRFGMKSILYNDSIQEDNSLSEEWNYETYLKKIYSKETTLSVWGGIYLRSIFISNNIRFNVNYSLGEDWLVLIQYLKCVQRIKIIDKPYYNYNKTNEDSITTVPSVNKFLQLNEVTQIICYDQDLLIIADKKDKATLKSNVCGLCIANMLITKSKYISIKTVVKDMKDKNIYPTFKEIFYGRLKIKYKTVLFLFKILSINY